MAKEFDAISKLDTSKIDENRSHRSTNAAVNMMRKLGASNGIEEVKTEKILIEVDPNRTRMWKYADRTGTDDDLYLGDLLVSMAIGKKQISPVLARKVEGEDGIDYELIYGRRRRAACIKIGRPLLLELTEEDDKTCSRYMFEENDNHADTTPLEKAKSWYIQFNDGLFESQREMAEHFGVPQKTMQRHLKAAPIWFDDIAPLIGDVKNAPLLDTAALMGIKESEPEKYASLVARLRNEKSLIGKKPSAKIKALLMWAKEERSP